MVQALLPEYDTVSELVRKQAIRGLGIAGSFGINDTILHQPDSERKYILIQILNDSIFNQIDGNIEGQPPTGVTIAAGTLIWGEFTGVKLASGVVLCYFDVPPVVP